MWKSFSKSVLIETIAVILGVTAVLIVDNRRDNQKALQETKNYFGLMNAQFGRDTLFVSEMRQDFEDQIQHMRTFKFDSLNRKEELLYIRRYFIYEPPVELLNSLMTSDSYNTIFDSVIFNSINDQLKDFKTFLDFQSKIDVQQKEFGEKYFLPFMNSANGKLEIPDTEIDLVLRNRVNYLMELYEGRYTTLVSIQLNYRKLIAAMQTKIHE